MHRSTAAERIEKRDEQTPVVAAHLREGKMRPRSSLPPEAIRIRHSLNSFSKVIFYSSYRDSLIYSLRF